MKNCIWNVVCWSRLLQIIAWHYWRIKYRSKQCGPRTDCSYRSSLILVHTVCHRAFLNSFSRRGKQTTFVAIGALRVNIQIRKWNEILPGPNHWKNKRFSSWCSIWTFFSRIDTDYWWRWSIMLLLLSVTAAVGDNRFEPRRDFQKCGMCDQQRLRPACAYALSDQSLC